MFVSMFFTSDSPEDDISDSETEDLAGLRIDDWLVFQMDKEVRLFKLHVHMPYTMLIFEMSYM